MGWGLAGQCQGQDPAVTQAWAHLAQAASTLGGHIHSWAPLPTGCPRSLAQKGAPGHACWSLQPNSWVVFHECLFFFYLTVYCPPQAGGAGMQPGANTPTRSPTWAPGPTRGAPGHVADNRVATTGLHMERLLLLVSTSDLGALALHTRDTHEAHPIHCFLNTSFLSRSVPTWAWAVGKTCRAGSLGPGGAAVPRVGSAHSLLGASAGASASGLAWSSHWVAGDSTCFGYPHLPETPGWEVGRARRAVLEKGRARGGG